MVWKKRMQITIKHCVVFSFFIVMLNGAALASVPNKALDYVRKADLVNTGFKSEEELLKLEIINAQGDAVERKMKRQVLERKNNGDLSIIMFLWPADVNGTKTLTWSNKNGNDDQWLYLPFLRKTKKISSRTKTGSFMGSEFSFEDIGSQEIEKYTYKFIKQVKNEKLDVTLIERYPVDKNSGYSKQVVTYDNSTMQEIEIKYFDRKGELLKISKLGPYEKVKSYWRPKVIEMNNIQTAKRSILTYNWSSLKIGLDLDPELFEKESLED